MTSFPFMSNLSSAAVNFDSKVSNTRENIIVKSLRDPVRGGQRSNARIIQVALMTCDFDEKRLL